MTERRIITNDVLDTVCKKSERRGQPMQYMISGSNGSFRLGELCNSAAEALEKQRAWREGGSVDVEVHDTLGTSVSEGFLMTLVMSRDYPRPVSNSSERDWIMIIEGQTSPNRSA